MCLVHHYKKKCYTLLFVYQRTFINNSIGTWTKYNNRKLKVMKFIVIFSEPNLTIYFVE